MEGENKRGGGGGGVGGGVGERKGRLIPNKLNFVKLWNDLNT